MLDARKAALVRRQIQDARVDREKVMLHPDIAAEMLDAWCEKQEIADMFAPVPGITRETFTEAVR